MENADPSKKPEWIEASPGLAQKTETLELNEIGEVEAQLIINKLNRLMVLERWKLTYFLEIDWVVNKFFKSYMYWARFYWDESEDYIKLHWIKDLINKCEQIKLEEDQFLVRVARNNTQSFWIILTKSQAESVWVTSIEILQLWIYFLKKRESLHEQLSLNGDDPKEAPVDSVEASFFLGVDMEVVQGHLESLRWLLSNVMRSPKPKDQGKK